MHNTCDAIIIRFLLYTWKFHETKRQCVCHNYSRFFRKKSFANKKSTREMEFFNLKEREGTRIWNTRDYLGILFNLIELFILYSTLYPVTLL